ncbi:SOS response-associated peptidase [Pseudoduganella violaceinigra]|uniref:SOS response-associated peptidase n=1 Tax=Pseudoduganella violaceinigra TaxID=246602 RepID=UPI000418334B|nr:SOS response-associated peptidase family protein [Pseudoduganella violaceinigra]
MEDAWKPETWKDYPAPIIRKSDDGPEAVLATYGMVPVRRLPPGVRFDSMNARSESVGEKRTFTNAWAKSHRCLVPMTAFYEPCYESGKAVRWGVGMADESMFAVTGLWKEWESDAGPEYSFTQLTINADEHPLMKRFHKAGDEKRALVVVPRESWDDWLECSDPEFARSFLAHYPAELMISWAFPVPPRKKIPANENTK